MKYAFLRFFLTATLSVGLSAAAPSDPSRSTIAEIAEQFDSHPLIMIGELHRSKEIHAFLQQMLRDPQFVCRADDIVVEFGNARLQKLADTYVSGGSVTEVQLQSLWRETVPPLTWNSPVYRQVYATVRDINRQQLCAHPLRIVLGDTPIDWSKVKTVKDYLPFTDRNGPYAAIVEREVLSKHHRALLIAGSAHAWKQMPKGQQEFDEPNVAELIERKHPGLLFCIVTVPLPGEAEALHMGPPPNFRVVRGSELEHADYGIIGSGATATLVSVNGKQVWKLNSAKNWPAMGKVVDGLLYLGGNTSLYPPPTIYLDPAYQQELRRRAAIIKAYNGQDFLTVIDDLVKQARAEKGH